MNLFISVKLWPPLGLRHHNISVRHALLKMKLQKIRRQNSHTTEPACFFFVTKHHLKGVQYKELAFLHPFEIENNCVADGRYKVFFGESVRIKVCVDSCWAEIVSAAATSCTTLIMVQIWLMVEVQEWEEDERSRRRRLIGIIEVRRSSTTGKIDQKKRKDYHKRRLDSAKQTKRRKI